MDSLGLGYDELREVRPDLVMTSITPFGQTGPYRDYEFTELTVFATSGAMYREGLPDREPLRYGGEMAQYYAGSAAAGVTMAACLRSCLDGLGRWNRHLHSGVSGRTPSPAGVQGPLRLLGGVGLSQESPRAHCRRSRVLRGRDLPGRRRLRELPALRGEDVAQLRQDDRETRPGGRPAIRYAGRQGREP